MYDKKTVKKFILNYHKTMNNSNECDEDVTVGDFFSVDDQAESHEIDNSNIEESIFYNEIDAVIENEATEEEHNLFLLLSNGVNFEEVGSIFGVQSQRIRQMLNSLLDKMK
ncbi:MULTISPECIES: sigma-70 family RNA polymerase sigma factor [Staphylococcus]|nr:MULTISPECIES: sigma-70 family RNA polymerase sigma factor [Staphylococcus]